MKNSIKSFLTRSIYAVVPRKQKLVILDNHFPNSNCGFKINEYNYLLGQFPGSEVFSTWPQFKTAMTEYSQRYPQYAHRVKSFTSKKLYFATLFYISFLHNTYDLLPLIEREQTPFVFTLYGGGFFGLHYSESDAKLARICASPWLRKIIVSQTVTARYLVQKGFCGPEKIELVYGSTPSENVTQKRYLEIKKQKYPGDKKTFDICFVGRRHTLQGKDKGYHLFIQAAQKIVTQVANARFHVVGDFNRDTIPIGNLEGKIHFNGELPIASLPMFFKTQDVYLSPNIPNQIHPDSFEGITGTCQEAAVAGTAVFCTDILKLNLYFTHKKDIVFIDPDSDDIVTKILYYYHHLSKLYALSSRGQQKFLDVFDFKKHVEHKAAVLREFIH